jgi:hypothetical protein
MSYERANVLDKTPGLAFEAFIPGTRNPMIPQAMYRPSAAGPRSLVGLEGLGAHSYYAPLRQMRTPLQGLGADPITELLGTSLDKALEMVILRSAPFIQTQVKPMIQPIQILMGITAFASVVGAGFAFLAWKKTNAAVY